ADHRDTVGIPSLLLLEYRRQRGSRGIRTNHRLARRSHRRPFALPSVGDMIRTMWNFFRKWRIFPPGDPPPDPVPFLSLGGGSSQRLSAAGGGVVGSAAEKAKGVIVR